MNDKSKLDPNTPADALTILAQVTANLTGTRADHQAIAIALDTIAKAIAPPADKKDCGNEGVA
jgi:hypothetical protein